MKPRIVAIFLASVGLLLAAGAPARAHHSFGVEYDANKPVTLTGVITSIEWTNPHSFVYIDVKGADGKVTNWKFEGYPPGVLYRTGWHRDVTMKVGDTITVFGWQARTGGAWGHARDITFSDGKKLFFGPAPGTGDGGATPPPGSVTSPAPAGAPAGAPSN
ncbi:MAG: hypothetical protein LAN36_08655 [Acidobacteriia bacterium]|nr:hypothetical protein [Terriglobia bacterium]